VFKPHYRESGFQKLGLASSISFYKFEFLDSTTFYIVADCRAAGHPIFSDFYFPDYKITLECDGEKHKDDLPYDPSKIGILFGEE
jgi:hypothetical protein